MLDMEDQKANYPPDRKSSGHAVRFTKALFASGAAGRAGDRAVLLVIYVAAQEDRVHYSKPPALWRKQILAELGWASPQQLHKARRRATENGLLQYYPGRKSVPGVYWTQVPDWLEPHYSKRPGRFSGSEYGSESSISGSTGGSENAISGSTGGSESSISGSTGGSHSYPLRSNTPSLPPGIPGEGVRRKGKEKNREEEEVRLHPALEAAP
jgi:hypothetical protein